MGRELLASKTIVQEEAPKIRQIAAAPLSITAMVGITMRGPMTPTRTRSYPEWFKIYGGDVAGGIAASAVRGFFENEGQDLWFCRTAHYSDLDLGTLATAAKGTLQLDSEASSPTKGFVLGTAVAPFDLEPGDTLEVDVNDTGAATATFTATAASRTAGNAPTYDLADGLTLLVEIDEGVEQTITFLTSEFVDIANATAEEVAAVINAKIVGASCDLDGGAPRITSDTRGTGSGVNVTGGTANTGGVNRLNFTTGLLNGTGNVDNIDAVTVAEVKTVVEGAVAGCEVTDVSGAVKIESTTPGAAPNGIQVVASSTADDELGLDNAVHNGTTGAAVACVQFDGKSYGAYAADWEVVVADATNGEADDFNLVEYFKGAAVKTHPNLSINPNSARYFVTVFNDEDSGSDYAVISDIGPAFRPANSPLVGGAPDPFGPMTGGNDGLADLADLDFIGSKVSRTGLQSFNTKKNIRVLAIPDQPTPAVASAMISWCENERMGLCFPIIDIPTGYTYQQARTYVTVTAALKGLSEFGAVYWPNPTVLNPDKSVYGDVKNIVCPISGHMAGFFARIAARNAGAGIYEQPAGFEQGFKLAGITGFETDEAEDDDVRDAIYPDLINPMVLPGYVDGTVTLREDGNFPSVGERRGVIHIEASVRDGIEFARHVNQTPGLRAKVKRSMDLFLLQQFRKGAFRGDKPSNSFYTDVGEGINPESEVFAKRMNILMGLATNKPTEWIIIKVSQDTRALDQELAEAGL